MPIYEYGCESCGHVLEVWAKVDDAPPAACPKCGQANPKKLISRTAFHLKGGGWYAQGYGSSGGAGTPAKSSDTSTPSATTSTTTSTTTSSTGSSGGSTP